jgi:glutaryl-CoA dehydrogenase
VRLSQMQDEGKLKDHASLAKAFCTVRMRETVAWARELLGGNGILLEEQVARFLPTPEALYSYEGTRDEYSDRRQSHNGIQCLCVTRSLHCRG